MPEAKLSPRSGLEQLIVPGPRGAMTTQPGVRIALRTDVALCSVMARKDRSDALARRVREAFALELPSTPRRVAAGSISFTWAGPDSWLVAAEATTGSALEARLRRELAGLASVADQSDGRIVISIGGAKTRDALAKGVPIDLHPRAFGPGDTAVTSAAYIGVHFWQVDDAPTYEFAVFRSFAAALWHWLVDASSEFRVEISGDR